MGFSPWDLLSLGESSGSKVSLKGTPSALPSPHTRKRNPTEYQKKQPRLRARLQPCHPRTRSGASAPEVRSLHSKRPRPRHPAVLSNQPRHPHNPAFRWKRGASAPRITPPTKSGFSPGPSANQPTNCPHHAKYHIPSLLEPFSHWCRGSTFKRRHSGEARISVLEVVAAAVRALSALHLHANCFKGCQGFSLGIPTQTEFERLPKKQSCLKARLQPCHPHRQNGASAPEVRSPQPGTQSVGASTTAANGVYQE